MAQRIKGQEVEVLLILDGEQQEAITAIRSFEVELMNEIISEGYLGESTDRVDDIFRGVSGTIGLHFEDSRIWTLFVNIINRSKRRTPGSTINIKTTLNFPNGQRPRIIYPNCFFGAIPIGFGSRSDYGEVTLNFQCDDFDVLQAAA